jgi:RNA polymerase sigma-70 factor (ECF subfamily)
VVEAVDLRQRRKEVRAAVAGIPVEQRQIIEMMYFDGLTQRDISERLQLPLGTVKSRTLLAMRKLRSALSEPLDRSR